MISLNALPGTIIQASAMGYAMICIGRVVGGVGNGMVCVRHLRHDVPHS
jgi:predicted MFS family arabinose efflux permease